ncbi:hypothetical protein EON65_34415 [archaeon]|nr:MAG: hypothetical protein EON65_34415 [archaeon]
MFLASKVEERPIKLKDVVAAFNAIYSKSASQTVSPSCDVAT